jgi:hypothetical protein
MHYQPSESANLGTKRGYLLVAIHGVAMTDNKVQGRYIAAFSQTMLGMTAMDDHGGMLMTHKPPEAIVIHGNFDA